ncbi:putative DNA helicase MCM8, partial [Cucurbita argyrosperma subsp. argyrosperma]
MDIGGGNYLYLAAVSIKNSKSQSIHLRSCNILTLMQEKSSCLIFSHSPKRLQFIMKFFSGECGSDVFCQILQSLCSSIYGHELVVLDLAKINYGKRLQLSQHMQPRPGLTVAVVRDSRKEDHAFGVGDDNLLFPKSLWYLQMVDDAVKMNLIKCLQNIRRCGPKPEFHLNSYALLAEIVLTNCVTRIMSGWYTSYSKATEKSGEAGRSSSSSRPQGKNYSPRYHEIMKESLYDKYADEHGVLDFGRSGGNESTERSQVIYECTHKQSELQHKDTNHICYRLEEIYSLADRIGRVADIVTFIENLDSV